MLTRGTPSITQTIADAVVLKDGDLFLLSEANGRVPAHHGHGLGLYHHDCRYLNTYEIRVAGHHPVPLGFGAQTAGSGTFQLTNPDLQVGGETRVQKEGLGIEWKRRLDGQRLMLVDHLLLRNWGHEAVEIPLEVRLGAEFEDVYEVRGLLRQRMGVLHPPRWSQKKLVFGYRGADRVLRELQVAFSAEFDAAGDGTARAIVPLSARGSAEVLIELSIRESSTSADTTPHPTLALDLLMKSDSFWLTQVLQRSGEDLDLLRSSIGGLEYYSAGLPWFGALFGRDALIAALEVLPFQPAMAAHTLRLLARYQGTKEDSWRDEQPGKILHELRRGELARSGAIPHTPYYGTVDATPLFLMLLGRHAEWTGDLSLFQELRPHVERALEWLRHYGDLDGDGYIEYRSRSEHGLINQGWKDSGDAIVDAEGRLATPPIALVEVQAYAYACRVCAADLYRRVGEQGIAEGLSQEAERLRDRFNRDFWVERIGCYALALEAKKRPLDVVSSNSGHALWCGIADPDKAAATVERLMADDMYTGWGIRTLAQSERGYTPIGYHLGTVWPHDNAIIAAGCRRYGFDQAAHRIFNGVTAAAIRFEHARLPELFTGFCRSAYGVPIRYPVACHPQAWAAGAIPFLLQTMLGLRPDGFGHRLHVTRPMLPEGVDYLELPSIQMAGRSVGLRFKHNRDGGVAVETTGELDGIEVLVEPESYRHGEARSPNRAGG